MILHAISQVGIFVFGGAAIWLLSIPERWSRWGYIFGACSVPFAFYATASQQQWGMFALTVWYAYSWTQGIYNFWIIPERR